MTPAAEKITIGTIRQDRSLWPRDGYDQEALVRYREAVGQLPPVRVDRASGILLDGFHRMRVFEEAGWTEVPVIYEECPKGKYLLRAMELNLHGMPIGTQQRNRMIELLQDQGCTQEEIAQAVGLSQERVSQILAAHKLDRFEGRLEPEDLVGEAVRLVDQGRSIREAAHVTKVPKSTVERAVVKAKDRQEVIRRHLQTRGGLTSLLRYSERGPWGKGGYFGNCTGYLLVDLIDYLKPASVFDPMEGSGTTAEVCFDLRVEYVGRDLQRGSDLLSSPLPDRWFDLIFWHPPYWPGHQYTTHPNDLSNAGSAKDYLDRLRTCFTHLRQCLSPSGHLGLLIGDGRKNGVFYPVHSEVIQWGLLPLEAVLIKDGDHERRARHFKYGARPFIPTLHEYLLLFKGTES